MLDGGNRFNAYPVAHAVRRQNQDPRAALNRIHLSRAFTCYQVDALLTEWQPVTYPTLVFDLLATFYDESVNLPESRRLLLRVLWQLEQLSKLGPVVVSTRMPATICAERMVLYEMLKRGPAACAWKWKCSREIWHLYRTRNYYCLFGTEIRRYLNAGGEVWGVQYHRLPRFL